MKGQVFTIAKLNYINGVVYFTAERGSTDITTLSEHYPITTKSGDVKHPKERVRMLVRLAKGLELLEQKDNGKIEITDSGRRYFDARAKDKSHIPHLIH